jgi:hypothetical protein
MSILSPPIRFTSLSIKQQPEQLGISPLLCSPAYMILRCFLQIPLNNDIFPRRQSNRALPFPGGSLSIRIETSLHNDSALIIIHTSWLVLSNFF